MAPPVEEQYRDLLNPIKDPEQSFQVDIALLLHSYVTSFVQGKVPHNFNSAALLLQGSSSIYSKKVEYLHNLATQLHQNLVKHKKQEQVKKETNKGKDKQKENKLNDPFFSTEIKLGKNLSCLKKKSSQKSAANKKTQKKVAKKHTFVPVDLLPFEEEKGDVFYDTRGDAVGNKGDFTLNKCRVTSSGWLMLPTVSPDQIPMQDAPPDNTMETSPLTNGVDEDADCDMADSSHDEGIEVGSQATTSSPGLPLSQQTDEGLGSIESTPRETLSQPDSQPDSQPMDGVESMGDVVDNHVSDGVEDIEIDGVVEDLGIVPNNIRRSSRRASKLRQQEDHLNLADENEENPNYDQEEEIVAVKRAIQKKNTCLPSLLLREDESEIPVESITVFCSRTFFSFDSKGLKNIMLDLDTLAYRNNASLVKRLSDRVLLFKTAMQNKVYDKNPDDEGDEEIDVETLMVDGYGSDELVCPNPLEDKDIVIENDHNVMRMSQFQYPPPVELSQTEPGPSTTDEIHVPNVDDVAQHHVRLFIDDVRQTYAHSDISKKVHAWEKDITPFLNSLDEREPFDINLYGSRILTSFEGAEGKQRKQTKTFRDFCQGMEKWQIHRYFMALLPLANIGNVELETEERPDGEEDILMTLMSNRMHHLELEEFGNNEE